jgi:hypothetical protein
MAVYTGVDDSTGFFTANLYSGNATNGTTITTGHTNDLIWTKGRAGTYGARGLRIIDSVRGATKVLYGDQNLAQGTNNSSSGVTGFASTSYTIGGDADFNGSGTTYVSWTWKESVTAGFDILTYEGTGSARTVAHNLGVKPDWIIVKNIDSSDPPFNWRVYHSALGATAALKLNDATAVSTDAGYWNDTEPTSSVFSVKDSGETNNADQTYIAYLWAGKQGFSKFGKFIGNGNNDGTFVNLGFKPAYLIIRESSNNDDWQIWDNKREDYNGNPNETTIDPSIAAADSDSTGRAVDFLSNGFKLRTSNATINTSGETFLYMAFAENPFVSSGGVPGLAR